jgi:hypothetical protein
VSELCADGVWPNSIEISHVGSSSLAWTATLPAELSSQVEVSPTSGTLAAGTASAPSHATLLLVGKYSGANFVVTLKSAAGTVPVTVQCASS